MGDLARILVRAPLAAAAIVAEARFPSVWPVPFPRSVEEIERDPRRLLDLLTRPSRGLLAPLAVPPGAILDGVRRGGAAQHEPAKHRTTSVLELAFRNGVPGRARVVVKLQSGRGMPLYMQAIRAAIEPFSREVEFYRRLASSAPIRVARPLFADAVTFVNRVCVVVEHVESTTPADWRGCSLAAMRAMLASAARLNAHFLGRLSEPAAAWIPARAGLDYLKFVGDFIGRDEPWYRDVWSALRRYFGARPVTLVHGDCRPGNMLFTGEAPVHAPDTAGDAAAPWPDGASPGQDVVMSDWEAVNVAPLLWDFTYATVIGLRTSDRDAWLDRLLEEFLASLAAGGVPRSELDAERCRMEVDLLAIVLAYLSLVVFEHQLWSGQGNTSEDIRAWGARVRHAVIAGDADAIGRAVGARGDAIRRLQQRFADRLNAIPEWRG